jgi:putative inorganic carbon (HCO3(-)) transporter
MALFFLSLYIIFTIVNPAEILPVLAPLRLAFWPGILGLLCAAAALFTRGSKFAHFPQTWAMVAFMFSLCISSLINERWLGAPAAVLGGMGVSATMFFLVIWSVDSMHRMEWVRRAILFSALALCVQGLYSCLTGWDAVRLQYVYVGATNGDEDLQSTLLDSPEYQALAADYEAKGDMAGLNTLYRTAKAAAIADGRVSVRVRGNGIMNDPNDLALGIVLALPFCWMAWKKRKRTANLLHVWIPTAIMITTIYYTKSRGGMIALLGILGMLWSRRLGKVKTIILLGSVTFAMFALQFTAGRSFSDESSEGRVHAWREGFQMFFSHPILGVGFRAFRDYYSMTAHNSFVLCFAESGLLGYFFWLVLIVASLMQLSALKNTTGDPEKAALIKHWAGALWLSMWGSLIGAFFLSRTYVCLFYLLAAMICGLTITAWKLGLTVKQPAAQRVFLLTLATEFASIIGIYMIVRLDRLV